MAEWHMELPGKTNIMKQWYALYVLLCSYGHKQKYIDGLVQDCSNSSAQVWSEWVIEWLSLTAFLEQRTARSI